VTRCRHLLVLACSLWAVAAAAQPSEVLRDQRFMSKALGRDATYDLYLPPDRDRLTALPVIYVLHGTDSVGADWLDKGDLQAIADRLIAAGTLPNCIIVMPDAGNSWYVDAPPPDGLGAMGTALSRDLPNWIDAHYPTNPTRSGRAVAGYSMGAFGALRFAVLPPYRFGAAAAMSSALWSFLTPETKLIGHRAEAVKRIFDGAFGEPFDPARMIAESPLTLVGEVPHRAPHASILMISGRHEMFDGADEQEEARRLFVGEGFPVEIQLTDGEHDWDNWRGMLPIVLAFLGKHVRSGVALGR
jgi:enterochelin esterase family protein